jgi:glycosyltransferase involved in cell wall biosynthesis
MVTEGTYPQSLGGVSVWCDQIVRGMSEHDFVVTPLMTTGTESMVWTVPENVSVSPIALWGPAPGRPARGGESGLPRVAAAYRRLLDCVLDPDESAVAGSAAALRALCGLAGAGPVGAVLRGEAAVRWLLDSWHRSPDPRLRAAAPSVHDAVLATDIIEHWLRPLFTPTPAGDVTHAVTNGLAAAVALRAKWTHGTPMLLTEHGIYLRERYLCFRTGDYTWPVKVVLLGFLRHLCTIAYRAADLITPGNQYNRRWELRGGAAGDAIRTVYNGVDPADFPPAGREPAVPTVTWAGRIDPIKDLETLIRGFALVAAQLPAARLRIFGGTPAGNERYLDRCRALAGSLGVAAAVSFEGRVRDIRDAYAAGHVVVLSSISEGFPYTLIEAMTTGRATVSTDVGGVSEAVADTGLVVRPRDPHALARACLRLLRDDLLRHRLGSAARRRALELFTVDKAVDAFRDIYADLAAGRPVAAEPGRRPGVPVGLARSA